MTAYSPSVHRTVVAANGESSRKFHSINKLLIDMDAAGMIKIAAQDLAPSDTTVVWLDLTIPEDGNGQAKVYDGGSWVPLTPEYFALHYGASTAAAAASALAAANSASAAEGFKNQTISDASATAADVLTADAAKVAALAAQSAAEQARDEAEIAADNFDDVYLGSKATDPTLDNDGDALVEGQLYWSSATNALKVYDGASWISYSAASGITDLVDDTSPQLGGNLDLNGHVITGLEIGTNVQAQSSNLDSWSMVVPSDYLTTTAAAAAYQPLSARLSDVAGLAVTDSNIIVGNGSAWVAESGGTARTSLGLGTGDSPQFAGVNLTEAAAPSTPASGLLALYAKADHKLYTKDDEGNENELGAPAIVGFGRFYASSFGATSGSGSDQKEAIQNCIDAAETYAATHGGADVVIDGQYRTEDTLRISQSGVSVVFQGGGSLVPVGDFDTIHLEHASASTWMYRNYIDRGRFDESGKTGGHLILSKFCAHAEWDLQAENGYDGVHVESFHDITIKGRITDYTRASGGAYIRAVGPGSARSDILRANITIGGDSNDEIYGLLIDGFVHTVTSDRLYAIKVGYGIVTQNTVSGSSDPMFLRMREFQCDYPKNGAFYGVVGTDFEFDGGYAHGVTNAAGAAFVAASSVSSLRLKGGRITGCQGHGIISGAADVTFEGMQVFTNGQATANTYSGILLQSASRDYQIVGVRSGSSSQKYGLAISSGADEYVVTGNNFLDNATAGVLNTPGTAATRVVANNL